MAWIRLDTDFFTNDEICDLSVAARYAVLGTLSYIKAHGTQGIVKATAKQIARASELSLNAVEDALKCSMFQVEGKMIQVVNWQRFQVDPTNATRQAGYRERNKDVTEVTVTDRYDRYVTGVTTTGQDRTGQDMTKEKIDKKEKFKPPTIEEVTAYFTEKNLHQVTPEYFFDFYESKNWMIGTNKMTKWKSAANRTKTWGKKTCDEDLIAGAIKIREERERRNAQTG